MAGNSPKNTAFQTFIGSWITKLIATLSTVVGLIAGLMSLYTHFDIHFKSIVEDNTIRITKEIQQTKSDLAELHLDDMSVRLRIKKRTIQSMQEVGNPVPERLTIEVDALEEQIEEIKNRWLN